MRCKKTPSIELLFIILLTATSTVHLETPDLIIFFIQKHPMKHNVVLGFQTAHARRGASPPYALCRGQRRDLGCVSCFVEEACALFAQRPSFCTRPTSFTAAGSRSRQEREAEGIKCEPSEEKGCSNEHKLNTASLVWA